jgi:hypothetical protein
MSQPPNHDGYTQPQYVSQPPQPPHPGWQPGWQPAAPEPPRKARPWAWVLLGMAILFALCLGVGAIQNLTGKNDAVGGGEPVAAEADSAAPAKKAPRNATTKAAKPAAAPGIGDKVRDGKFEFVVTGMDCSKTRVGDEYLHAEAQGKFCIISVIVTNIGDEAQMFSGSSQKAFDMSDASYDNDSGAEIYINKNADTFLNNINPGNTVHGKVLFDVPQTTTLITIELHDSFWSRGVKVDLR